MNKSAATDAIRQQLKEVAIEVKELGGWPGFKSGEWLFQFQLQLHQANAETHQ